MNLGPIELALIALLTPLFAAGALAIMWPVRKEGAPAAYLSIGAASVSLVASIWRKKGSAKKTTNGATAGIIMFPTT